MTAVGCETTPSRNNHSPPTQNTTPSSFFVCVFVFFLILDGTLTLSREVIVVVEAQANDQKRKEKKIRAQQMTSSVDVGSGCVRQGGKAGGEASPLRPIFPILLYKSHVPTEYN